ncbi:MAG: hypothetical protein ABI054_09595 [Planctomycetota bacterium]
MTEPTGCYRLRRAWFGFGRVLQQQWIVDEALEWRDVPMRSQVPQRVFSIVRPSEWVQFRESAARIALMDRRAEIARASRRRRDDKPEFEASRLG